MHPFVSLYLSAAFYCNASCEEVYLNMRIIVSRYLLCTGCEKGVGAGERAAEARSSQGRRAGAGEDKPEVAEHVVDR